MSENENKFDISKHPIVVIALAVVGTFGFSYQFVLPIMTAKLQNDVDKIPSYVKQIEEDKIEIGELNKKLQQVESQLAIVQHANLFVYNNPYPVGLGNVRIGDPIENLIAIYGEKYLEKQDSYWSVNNKHSIFKHITYYFNEKSSKKEITHIAFREELDVKNRIFLQSKLEDIFGQPIKYKRQGFYAWKFAEATIYKHNEFDFLLMSSKYSPSFFPEK